MRGLNLWADFPVAEVWLDLSDHPPGDILWSSAYLRPRLGRLLPGLKRPRRPPIKHDQKRHERWLTQVLLEIILELAARIGKRPDFTRVRHTSEPGVYRLVFQSIEGLPAADCAETALEIVKAALAGTQCDAEFLLEALRGKAQDIALTPTGTALLTAAQARGIPVRRLPGELLQFGHGARQRRWFRTVPAEAEPATLEASQNRELLDTLLAATGLGCTDAPVKDTHYRILVAGQRVLAALWWQLDSSGNGIDPTITDVSGLLHDEVRARCLDAVRALGLETAEVRLAVPDITQSLESQGGRVSEVVSYPPLDLYLKAVHSCSIADACLDTLFRPGETGRIPIVAVSGTNGKTTVTRLIAHGLGISGRFVGMTCTDGIYLGERRIDTDDCAGPKSARLVLLNPQVEAAVLETARGGILREGLGFDACDVAVVTNIGEGDHLGLGWIDTVAELAEVKQTLVRGVGPEGTAVLNADDPLVARMARHCRGDVLFFAREASHPLILRHRRNGRRVAFTRGLDLILAEGKNEWTLLPLSRIPLTHDGQIRFQVENVLAGAAALWSLGVPLETLTVALETFGADLDKSPGRFNVLAIGGATVVFDYGHNPSALIALIEALGVFPHRRRLAVYSAAGDRRDVDLIRQGEILGHAFDQVILYEDHYTRGRQPGEIMSIFNQGLALGKRVREIQTIHGWQNAVESALWQAQPGDLLLIQADVIDETVDFVRAHLAGNAALRELPLLRTTLTAASARDPAVLMGQA
ncbi:UDP-N-acetylmuramyl tripeptide synthase [Thiocystis violascens DSM 198]|uniref:UDP-N-acetylmuramyl tripeptide synthase n=1 Tax=Thiocystis violascens (strain ATCC 17096 / DSM 198 / 6111) TaxID=765911 RepID=I3Y567_THIV6|nr:UDP-N-acetylmuramyl tripeptide synthase [Thiocystis violascens DSM 198]